jgi:cbb3-type cytochrome oxidase subunit 3
MLEGSDPKPRGGTRSYLIVSWSLIALILLYVGWVFYSRRQENREIEQRAAARRRADDQRTVDMLGGNRFDILSFYASPGTIRRGDTAQLCYGVSNAKSVRLEPQADAVWPSYSRCVQVSPEKSTTYTLTADDGAGHSKTATVTIEVR